PDYTPLQEVARSSQELSEIQISNQWVVINGLMDKPESDDQLAKELYNKQTLSLKEAPKELENLRNFFVPLRSYNMTGIDSLRNFFFSDKINVEDASEKFEDYKRLNELVEYLYATNKRVVFTMGKGGVGKSTMAATIASGLAAKGQKVHLTTTDPAD